MPFGFVCFTVECRAIVVLLHRLFIRYLKDYFEQRKRSFPMQRLLARRNNPPVNSFLFSADDVRHIGSPCTSQQQHSSSGKFPMHIMQVKHFFNPRRQILKGALDTSYIAILLN